MPRTLKVVNGEAIVDVPTDRPFVVGRGKTADLVMSDSRVSRRHLVIESTDGDWSVVDLSANGTWLDGQRVRRVPVHGEARLRLGTADGPEITLLLDPPVVDSVSASFDHPHFNQVTMRPNEPGQAPGPRLPVRADGDNRELGPEGGRVHALTQGRMSLGRGRHNDIVLEDLLASREHAELFVGRSGAELVDLGSSNGTFVNGQRITRAPLSPGDVFAIGHHVFQLRASELFEYIDSGDVAFEAAGLNVFVGQTQLLHDVTFRLPGRALLAVIGPSGAGKSTLLNALTGFRPATSGTVHYSGRDMYMEYDELRRRIGYVPQDDILHASLTVRQALEYGAKLRFPAETTKAERRARVDAVIAELGLTAAADDLSQPLPIVPGYPAAAGVAPGQPGQPGQPGPGWQGGQGFAPPPWAPYDGDPRFAEEEPAGGPDIADRKVETLSGGQRKRTSVALELLTEPTLLYLDEPTSGLDPGLDKEVMESLRRLADGGRTVVVVTHSVAQLAICDYVLVLAKGGRTAFFGPPQHALPFFGQADWADVFRVLKSGRGAAATAARFRASNYYVKSSVVAPPARPTPVELPSIRQQSVFSQLATLSRRFVSVIAADRSYLRLVIAFPFVLGLIPRVIDAPYGLDVVSDRPNREATLVLLVMVLCACFMGMANSVREIVKEREIYRRERAIGLSRGAYLGSKVLVLTIVTTLQSVVFTVIGIGGRAPADGVVSDQPLLEMILAIAVVAWASAMMGLVLSAVVDNADKTMPLLVVLTMSQLVFTGGLMPVADQIGLEQVSYLSPARWGFAAVASAADLNTVQRLGDDRLNPGSVADGLWNHTASAFLTDVGGCVAVGLVSVAAIYLMLGRLDPRVVRRQRM